MDIIKTVIAGAIFILFSCASLGQRPEVSYNQFRIGGTRVYQEANALEVEYNPLSQENSPVEYRVLPDEQFQSEVAKLTDIKDVYSVFHLLPNTDRTIVYVKKSCVKAEYIKEILALRDKIYVRYSRFETRMGYSDVTVEMNSLGGYRYRRENNWVQGLGGLEIIGDRNPVVIFHNGFYPDRFPLGSPLARQQSWVQRINRDRESTLFLAKKPAIPPVVPEGKNKKKS